MSSGRGIAQGHVDRLRPIVDELKRVRLTEDPEAAVLLVGSVNEGLGNARSDLDVLIIHPTDRYIEELTPHTGLTTRTISPTAFGGTAILRRDTVVVNRRLDSGVRLQLEITREDLIARLQEQARVYLDAARARISAPEAGAPRRGFRLGFLEHKLLHRVYSATEIRNGARAEALRAALPASDLTEYLVLAQANFLFGVVDDLLGIYEQRPLPDPETRLFLLQQAIAKTTLLVLAAVGELNVGEKFSFRLLRHHARQAGPELVSRLTRMYRDRDLASPRLLPSVLELLDHAFARVSSLRPLFAANLRARGHTAFAQAGWTNSFGADWAAPAPSSSKAAAAEQEAHCGSAPP